MTRIAYLLVISCVACAVADLASDVEGLTGGVQTRLVWLHGGNRFQGNSSIQGFDSDQGTIRTIRSEIDYRRVVLCSGGQRMVATTDSWKVVLIPWDGSSRTELVGSGICNEVWTHPQTGEEWAFVRTGGESTSGDLYRYLISDPSQRVLVWNGSNVGISWLSWIETSADGTMAVDFLPWDKAYVLWNGGLADNVSRSGSISSGCWSSVAPDNSYIWFHLVGTHDKLNVFREDQSVKSGLAFNMTRPSGYTSSETYHPRFASKGPRFLTCTAGYQTNQTYGGNQNCPGAEIYLGKFAVDYKSFNGWVRVTDNSVGDFNADAWVGVTATSNPTLTLSPTSLEFSGDEGGSNPSDRTVTATAGGGLDLSSIAVNESVTWLNVAVSGSGDTRTLTNQVNLSGLTSGQYSTTVTVTADGRTRTYTVTLAVEGVPVATTIDVTPSTTTLLPGDTVQFSATVYDQTGAPLAPQPSITWSSNPSGAIDGGGVFTAPASDGDYAVTAAVGGISGSATATVTSVVTVAITSAHEGLTYGLGEAVTITWTASVDAGMNLFVSPNDGEDWVLLNGSAAVWSDGGVGSYSWTVASPLGSTSMLSSNCRFKVEGYWDNTVLDISGMFTIAEEPAIHLKVNCGDGSPAAAGWEDDASYLVAGQEGETWDWGTAGTVDLGSTVGPAPADAYRTARHRDHAYSFSSLPDGTYRVRLHFMDCYTEYDRRMDYTIEGVKVLDDFTILDESGGVWNALVKEFTVDVSDGNGLQIVCEKDLGGNVFESAIEVLFLSTATEEQSVPVAHYAQSAAFTVHHTGRGATRVSIAADGRHDIAVHALDGARLFSGCGIGSREYTIDHGHTPAVLTVTTSRGTSSRVLTTP